MMFFLRLAFWLMLIFLLLPNSLDENRRLMSSAEKTVDDVRGFCDRNPEVCDTARGAFTNLLAKVKSGMEIIEMWARAAEGKDKDNERLEIPVPADRTPPRGSFRPAAPIQVTPKWRDSLNADDRRAPWHDPSRL